MRVAHKRDIWWVLVLLAVLGLSVIMLSLAGSDRGPGTTNCVAGVTAIWYTLVMYSNDHGAFPGSASDVRWPFKPVLLCPVKRREGLSSDEAVEGWGDYIYFGDRIENMGPEHLDRMPILFDKVGNHPDGTRTVLFADGHIEVLSEKEFEGLIRTTAEHLWQIQ